MYDPSATEMIDTLVSPITLAQLSPELTDVQNDSTDPVGPLTRKSTFRLYAKKVELDTGNPVIRNRRSTFSIYAGSSTGSQWDEYERLGRQYFAAKLLKHR